MVGLTGSLRARRWMPTQVVVSAGFLNRVRPPGDSGLTIETRSESATGPQTATPAHLLSVFINESSAKFAILAKFAFRGSKAGGRLKVMPPSITRHHPMEGPTNQGGAGHRGVGRQATGRFAQFAEFAKRSRASILRIVRILRAPHFLPCRLRRVSSLSNLGRGTRIGRATTARNA
jgi:hypothetical protein